MTRLVDAVSLGAGGLLDGFANAFISEVKMDTQQMTQAELIAELDHLKHRVLELEAAEAEREHLVTALKESNQKLQLLFEALPIGVSVLDHTHRVILQNAALEKILGISREGLQQGEYRRRIYLRPDGTPMPTEEFASSRVFRGEPAALDVETGVIKEDGSLIWLNVSAISAPFSDWATILVTADITGHRLAEDALRDSEAQYRSLINLLPSGVIVHRQGQIEFANLTAARLFGASSPDQLVGTALMERIHPDFRQVVRQRVAEVVEEHKVVTFLEEKLLCLDGSVFDAEVAATPFVFDGHLCVLALYNDISQRKQSEKDVIKALAEKETLLRELYHRTRNNMSTIIALLNIQSDSFDDERLRTAFKDAQERIYSMALVHQKLYEASDLSRINLKEYIMELMRLLWDSYRIASTGQVSYVFNLDDVYVLIDTAVPCGLIMNELITNALKYAFPDGRNGEITVELHRAACGEIHLGVSDNGVGLPGEFDIRHDGHMGLQIILALAESQLDARMSFQVVPGVSCQLYFHDNLYEARV